MPRAPSTKTTKKKKRVVKKKAKKVVKKPVKKKRKKGAKKDLNAPKRAPTAFLLYANDKRPALKAKNPEFTIAQLAINLGKQWRNLSAKAKSPYEAQAEARRNQYLKEKAAYDKEKAANAPPKRPPTGFLCYSSHRRPQLQKRMKGATVAQIAKVLGQEWKAMPEGRKKPYLEKAKELREDYLVEKEAWDAARR